MSQPHKPSDSATDTMHRYETNTDRGDSAPSSNDPATDPVPATEPLPDPSKHDDGPIPMSDRRSPWQSESGGTEAKEGDPEVRTV